MTHNVDFKLSCVFAEYEDDLNSQLQSAVLGRIKTKKRNALRLDSSGGLEAGQTRS